MISILIQQYPCVLTEEHEQKLPAKHERLTIHNNGTAVICDAKDLAEIDSYFPAEDGEVILQPFGTDFFRAIWLERDIPKSQVWELSGGYYICYFNCPPTLASAAIAHGGSLTDKGFWFHQADAAGQVIKVLGANVEIPDSIRDRPAEIQRTTQEPNCAPKLRLAIRRVESDGFIADLPARGKWFVKFVNVNPEPEFFPPFDHKYRNVTSEGQSVGWFAFDEAQNEWDQQPAINIKMMLRSDGVSDIEQLMGRMINCRRKLVQRPFESEFPSDTEWNFKAPQFTFQPAAGNHPHWDLILNHVGQELDGVLPRHSWANRYGIKTGRQYLQLWIASMLREPFEPLPYLFLYGPQESGKSILHEASACGA